MIDLLPLRLFIQTLYSDSVSCVQGEPNDRSVALLPLRLEEVR